ncbi:hypothetical protein JTE90_017711 [Oedothorax gibbosus]|uniref:Uncharacterized protein n=1 Tax=Oedothorax gibbosus TaxID=931172 RepID=A0AAV6U831_9ARAC|nr:hypothetical protein JTE90_017711 [Oedothorax gibbosus]
MTKVGNLEQDGKGVPRDHDSEWYCKYFSSYLKITRMVAWIKRFIYNCKKTNHVKLTGELTALEIHAAEKNLLKLVQRESFTSKEDKRLAALDVYEDEQDVKEIGTPDFDVVDNTRLNKRLKHRQKLIADLRARFRSEYLGLLIQRPQHKKWISQISIGDIVLIGCEFPLL